MNAWDLVFLTDEGLANRLRVSLSTTTRWRKTGEGPMFVRFGPRRVLYRLSDVERWEAARTFDSLAEERAR